LIGPGIFLFKAPPERRETTDASLLANQGRTLVPGGNPGVHGPSLWQGIQSLVEQEIGKRQLDQLKAKKEDGR
jgi:hypothetical protein